MISWYGPSATRELDRDTGSGNLRTFGIEHDHIVAVGGRGVAGGPHDDDPSPGARLAVVVRLVVVEAVQVRVVAEGEGAERIHHAIGGAGGQDLDGACVGSRLVAAVVAAAGSREGHRCQRNRSPPARVAVSSTEHVPTVLRPLLTLRSGHGAKSGLPIGRGQGT